MVDRGALAGGPALTGPAHRGNFEIPIEYKYVNKMTAVELIEEGIKAREKYWHDQYQQGYQRALSDIMLYIEEAKQIERDQTIAFTNDYITNADWSYQGKTVAQYYNEKYSKYK